MDINRENMTKFFDELRVEFTAAFQANYAKALHNMIATSMPSNGTSITHGWLKQLPKMREWLGDRVVNNVNSQSLTITNRLFESTLEMPRVDIEDNIHGLYRPIVAGMGADAAMFPEEVCMEALLKGTSWTWADGSAFFYDSRLYGAATIDNYSTSALTVSTFNTAYQAMTSYIGHSGKPLGVRPMYLLHGPALRNTAFEILRDDFAARNADATGNPAGLNPNKGTVVPIQSAHLVDGIVINGTSYDAANYWFLFGECAGLRGIVYQDRMAAELQTQKWNPQSEFTFDTDKFQIGARLRGEAFLALPHCIHGNFAT